MIKTIFLLLLIQVTAIVSCTNGTESRQREEARAVQEARKVGKLLTGQAVGISDGDTFRLLMEGKETVRVRLHGVDAPEKGQDYGTQAKQMLSDLIFSKKVDVIRKNKDRYGRIVGVVYIDGLNVNEVLLSNGLVWHYTDYDKNEEWAALQSEARNNKRGLWSKRNPTPPWQWRKEKRAAKANAE